MNQQQFVRDVILGEIRDCAYVSTLGELSSELSNEEEPSRVEMAMGWFQLLNEQDKARVLTLLRLAIDNTIFRVLVNLDGDNAIDDVGGYLELHFRSADGSVDNLLAPPKLEALHELYGEYSAWVESA